MTPALLANTYVGYFRAVFAVCVPADQPGGALRFVFNAKAMDDHNFILLYPRPQTKVAPSGYNWTFAKCNSVRTPPSEVGQSVICRHNCR